jgi:hypothetical protein
VRREGEQEGRRWREVGGAVVKFLWRLASRAWH